ncbi:MAG TPA: hypothetical protein VN203_17185, partial [Candidatus Acidoferrum sp.]|nr:hypothetical protein [Candidatus Acidoferrum sp.]
DSVDPLDEAFLNALKLKLPGKSIKATHEVRKDPKGKDQAQITRLERVAAASGKSKPAPGGSKAKAEKPEKTEKEEESW